MKMAITITIKEFKIQRALGTTNKMYSVMPDGFFGKIVFDSFYDDNTITIPYWLSIKLVTMKAKKLIAQLHYNEIIYNYIEEHLK